MSIVDDDESVRESLPTVRGSSVSPPRVFSLAEAFLASYVFGETSCPPPLHRDARDVRPPTFNRLTLHGGQRFRFVFITGLGMILRPRPPLARAVETPRVKLFMQAALLDTVRAALLVVGRIGARDGDRRSPAKH